MARRTLAVWGWRVASLYCPIWSTWGGLASRLGWQLLAHSALSNPMKRLIAASARTRVADQTLAPPWQAHTDGESHRSVRSDRIVLLFFFWASFYLLRTDVFCFFYPVSSWFTSQLNTSESSCFRPLFFFCSIHLQPFLLSWSKHLTWNIADFTSLHTSYCCGRLFTKTKQKVSVVFTFLYFHDK